MWNFNPRAPCGARPGSEQAPGFENCISIHAPRAGRDIPQTMAGMSPAIFQSTRPVRGATGERSHEPGQGHISIHAPRAGRDHLEGNRPEGWTISIHAPRAGRDKLTGLVQGSNIIFQSTRPVRGATPCLAICRRKAHYFNPRAPCGARRRKYRSKSECASISIHAPRAGRDQRGLSAYPGHRDFNPRAPCGARPRLSSLSDEAVYFNPRAPCGARPAALLMVNLALGFQSTRPVRGATWYRRLRLQLLQISIHAPRAGRDSKSIQNYFTHFCDKRQFLDNFTQNAAF